MVSWGWNDADSETSHIFQVHMDKMSPLWAKKNKKKTDRFDLVCVSDLVFTPQQAIVVVFDAGADEVHAMVLNSKVKISEPEHHPDSGGTRDKRKCK